MAFQFSVKPPMFEDEGALHYSRGKFILSVSGVQKDKQVSERARNIAIVSAVIVVIAILAITTVLAGKEPTNIPYEIELRSAIGQPMENALVNAGLKSAKLTETAAGVYTVEEDIKVDGIPFDLQLYVDDGALCGFAYTAEYEADAKKAAKDIYNILVDLRIDSYTLEDGAEPIAVNKKVLRNHLEEGKDLLIENGMNVTPSELVGALRSYLQTLETSENWEGSVHGYLVRPAQVYMDRSVAYEQHTNTVKMQISYMVEVQRDQ